MRLYAFCKTEKMNGPKPGYKTTEFWLTLLGNLVTIVGNLKGIIPGQAAAIALVVLDGVYGIMRGLVKINAPPNS